MALPLPDLDTRRFADLADEARAAIPRFAPAWTDHNLSDPGITLNELVAAELDRLMYAVNRVTDRDRRTVLRLLGFAPLPPAPARAMIAFRTAAAPRTVSAGTVVQARDPGGSPVPFRTDADVRVGTVALAAVQVGDAGAMADVTRAVRDRRAIPALGLDPDPARQSSLLLGFDGAPEAGFELSLALACGSDEDPARIAAEYGPAAVATHHGARTVWEAWDGTAWQPIAGVVDGTRALTRDGRVTLPIAAVLPVVALAPSPVPCAWVRCRLDAGRHDVAPTLVGVAVHAVSGAQQIAASSVVTLAAGCAVPAGHEPAAGTAAGLSLAVGLDGVATAAAAGVADLPDVTVTHYAAATAAATGSLTMEAAVAGLGDRSPHQQLVLPGAPVAAGTVAVWVATGTAGLPVAIVPGFDASGPDDLVATLDAQTGTLVFGDGRRGRTLAEDETVLARYDRTLAAAGNLRPDAKGDVDPTLAVALPFGATGGADAEAVVHAAGRAARLLMAHERLLELVSADGPPTLDLVDPVAVAGRQAPERALNEADLERIVLDAAGCRVVRARAFAELDPALPGLRAAGAASVIVVPGLPVGRPEPTGGLLAAVRQTVERRRLVGSRIVVAAPTYVVVAVKATLSALPGVAAATAEVAARAAIDAYLDPVTGGPDGRGWPFGRDVYRADVMARLDAADGIDAVVSLDLIGPDGVSCGNVCVPPMALAAPGEHVLEVLVP